MRTSPVSLCACALAAFLLAAAPAGSDTVTANWTGGGAAESYNDPNNWDPNTAVPLDGGGDVYIVNLPSAPVNFDVPGTGHQVFQLVAPGTFDIDNGRDLAVQDSAAIGGLLTTVSGTFTAGHASSSFTGDTARVHVSGGGQVTLAAPTYDCSGLIGEYTVFLADGNGSQLDLSSLTSMSSSRNHHYNLRYIVRASADGVLDLSSLTTVTAPVQETIDRFEFIQETGGRLLLDGLTTTGSAGNGHVRFVIKNAPGDLFSLPSLQQSNRAEFFVSPGVTVNLGTAGSPATQSGGSYTLEPNAVVNYMPLTTLHSTAMSLDADSEFHAPNLVSIDGTVLTFAPGRTIETGVIQSFDNARIAVNGGQTWGAGYGNLSATTYDCSGLIGEYTIFSADGNGSELDLSSLTSMSSSRNHHYNIRYVVKASANGVIDLSNLTAVTAPVQETIDRFEFIQESGGRLLLDSLAATGSGGSGHVRFHIKDTPGGAFALPALQQSDRAEFIVDAGLTVNLGTAGTPATQSGGSYTLAPNAVVNYLPLTALHSTAMSLGAGSEFHAPNLSSIDGTVLTFAPGRTIETGVIASMDNARIAVNGGQTWGAGYGNVSATTYDCSGLYGEYTIFSADGNGSELDLSTLTNMTSSLNHHYNLRYIVKASAGGVIDLSNVTAVTAPVQETGDRFEFIQESGGRLLLDSLAATGSGGSGHVRFHIKDTPGGAFALPALQQSDRAEFIVDAGLTVNLGTAGTPATQSGGSYTLAPNAVVNYEPLTALTWTSVTLGDGAAFQAPNLVDFSGSTVTLSPGRTFRTGTIGSFDNARLAVADGAQWGAAWGTLSAVSYSCTGLGGSEYDLFTATGPNSVLDLSTLGSIDASRDHHYNLRYTIQASEGGTVDLSGLTTVTAPVREPVDHIRFLATTGGTLDLSSLQTVIKPGSGYAAFSATSGGTLKLGDLLITPNVNLSAADAASKIIADSLDLAASASIAIVDGATLALSGDFSYDITDEAQMDLDEAQVHFHTAGEHWLEVGGEDLGPNDAGPGNFALGRLIVGSDTAAARVTLVDLIDNSAGAPDALYLRGSGGLDGLSILGGSMLILGDVPVYAHIDGNMVELHDLFGQGETLVAFQDAAGGNDGWLAIPEPATLALLSCGLVGILGRRRRS